MPAIHAAFPAYTAHGPEVPVRIVTPRTPGCFHRFFDRQSGGAQMNFGGLGRFVRTVDARKIFQRPLARFGVQPLHIAALTFFQRRIDKHLDEFAFGEQFARHAPLAAER